MILILVHLLLFHLSYSANDCWWSGCQPNTWAVTGCGQYNRTQQDIRGCEGGSEYYCCTLDTTTTTTPAPQTGCWWTGCQPNNWKVTGCEQYSLVQNNIQDCENGHKYFCCPDSNHPKPPLPTDLDTSECVWSPCQPSNWTVRGCPPRMIQIGSQSCGEGQGDIFQCCESKQIPDDDDTNLITGESFQNFVKYLLIKGKNFTVEPDSLPCISIDVEKKSILKIKNEGIRTCDLCPYFPQKRFVNVFLSNEPLDVESNLLFPECFGSCFDRDDCVAFSYDYSTHTCYIFNNTVGVFTQSSQWTTVFMTQPMGVLENWSYFRHTSITGEGFKQSREQNFKECLKKCNHDDKCNYVSYSIKTLDCVMITSQDKIQYIDMKYGFISAFKITSLPFSRDASSRFIEIGEEIFGQDQSSDIKKNECASIRNETHSAFYSKSCFTYPGVGCDSVTGCKTCYYPENTNDFYNLIICPDSKWVVNENIKQSIQSDLMSCLKDSFCIALGYDTRTKNTKQLTIEDLPGNNSPTKFIMRYPIILTENQKLIMNHDLLSSYDIERISNDNNSFHEISGKSFKECFNIFDSSNSYIRMSYANKMCKISSKEVKYVRSDRFITVFKKPDITSPIINYVRTPGFSIEENKAKQSFGPCTNCEIDCAIKCNSEFKSWCSHFMVRHDHNKAECFFYDLFSDTAANNVILQQMDNKQIFTKVSNLDFTLDSLNKLNPFQSSDILNCFQPDSDNKQTETSLTRFDISNSNSDSAVQLRQKRGIGDFFKGIGKALKKVGEVFVDTVKDTAKAVVDTAKGVVNTVKNVVTGDFDKAKESFVNIPIVKDVSNAVELGKAVVTGDWDKAREKGSELLQGQALDIATSLIPVGGKFIGKGLKAIGKAVKKKPLGPKKISKRDVDGVNNNNRKVPENKKNVDKNRRNCKKRPKRMANKRPRPGSCDSDDDDDDEDNLCPTVSIPNVIQRTLVSGCSSRKKGAICDFECEPGYQEPNSQVKCVGRGNQRPTWIPTPTCDRINCGAIPYPLISLQTPQVNKLGSTVFGHFVTVYVALFNLFRKLPVWTIALHQSTQFGSKDYAASKDLLRAHGYKPFPCTQLARYQGSPSDYSGKPWDQGHLTPANIARWSEKARLSSNLYINLAPQDPFTNQGPWKRLETAVECFSRKRRSLVATGLCNNNIGKTNTLEIPSCYWKMVCYKDENLKEQVVGFMASNNHPANKKEKNLRRKQVYTPLSQYEIQRELQALNLNIRSPWIHSASSINAGRPVAVGTDASVWFPVNPFACERADTLSETEKNAWIQGLPEVKDKKKRRKRETTPAITRGCHSTSELRNMQSLLGIISDGEDGDEDELGSGSQFEEGGGSTLVNVQNCNKRIIGYYTSWGKKKISGRELRRLTHVIYAFLEMKEDGTIDVGSADRKNAQNINDEVKNAKERLENLMELAALHPHVKIMFAVGGWENSQYFSDVAASPQKRITFIASIVKMIQRYGFDGVDIDWEYPVTGGANEGIPQDKQNYVNLMKEIRSALDNLASEVRRGEKFLLSFAGAAGQWTLDPGFDLPGLLKHADFANIMSYDYFGAWSSKWGAYTGPPSPLYFGMPPRFSGKTNVDWTVKYYTCKTQLPHKINIGLPFYGRFWKNVGQPVDGKDGMWRTAERVNGVFEGGYKAWNEIPEFLETGGFEQNFHEKSRTPYAWNPASKTFLGYENKKSLEAKVQYAVKKNVGGLMIWSVELDDDDLTLLNTVYQARLCDKTNPNEINHKCSPIDEKRWWTSEDGDDMAGLCGRSAPLYKGYYPVCDPDDPGYSCCGPAGYCGSGEKYCDCPTCKNYGDNPQKILEQPIKPTVPVTWYFLNAEEGKRGRCGRKVKKLKDVFPTCNPDDDNAYCCSNGGYCGSKPEHCTCNGCINFKKNKNYRYGPKKWWDQSDGEDKAGKCGPKVPKVDGIYEAECEPNTKFNCCSKNGYCGSGPEYCDCPGCKKFT
ncbi:uncharacterized protein LOC128997901 [Macrosteles quadrilineatus]|uniref:uncharacterized protein LOC128997901 n=1 Tax=Macrosteles quadrilineatus TaxID=74068 RepID=UPI0023E1BCE7|nr:uncharacterized protein LOC128997901 [Macrosteles quadrilineatus]